MVFGIKSLLMGSVVDMEPVLPCEDVSFKTLDGLTLRGTLYPGRNQAPGIIMTPGFNLTRETLIPKVAQYFQKEGLTSLVFDPRSIGSSDGLPRNNINPAQQTADYHDALTYLKSDARVDSRRIAFWGFSFSGTVALAAAALDTRARLVIAVCPLTTWDLPSSKYRGVLSKAMQDRESQLAGNKPYYIPMITDKGENPVGFGVGMGKAELDLVLRSKERQPNLELNTSIQTYYNIMAWSPFETLRILSPTPMLLVTPENDQISPMAQQRDLIFNKVAGPKEMHVVGGKGHMDVLDGDSFFTTMAAQVGFIRQHFDF
ncbi:DltD N-terminal domain protein [Camillea tinctor]|nr:DltD N-terminal domain protein [Camillea tinctor]